MLVALSMVTFTGMSTGIGRSIPLYHMGYKANPVPSVLDHGQYLRARLAASGGSTLRGPVGVYPLRPAATDRDGCAAQAAFLQIHIWQQTSPMPISGCRPRQLVG